MDSIAHIRQSDGEVQTVESHLIEVKNLGEQFGKKIGVEYLAGLAGMLHDVGKYNDEFKEYILEAVKHPENPPKRGSVDHSTAGGKLLYELFHTGEKSPYKIILAEIVGNAIISHHSYLQDFLGPDLKSNYLNRVKDKELIGFEIIKKRFFEKVISRQNFEDYVDVAASEVEKYLAEEAPENYERALMFLTKFIFSALIDGDRTNTRLFEENKTREFVDHKELFNTYYERLMDKVNLFKSSHNRNSPINHQRAFMSDQCDSFADRPSGVYTLSIPTGGGKTLSSLRYALKHAIRFNKKHVIYIVPYTTIIEQNADEVRKVLKDEANILEHHSNVIDDINDGDENQDGLINLQQKLKLAKDNWDSPIIFTTMVQFLNVFYAKGSRNIRRLHNLCESVIIFDEVQKVPISCVSLFNQALNFLKNYGHSSIVLCTATQPALDFVEHKLELNTDAEMINDLDHAIGAFKRVEIIDKATSETFNNEKLCDFVEEKLNELESVLVILNTKTVVRNLYQMMKEREGNVPIYHLSTSMCATHRNDILDEVKQHLREGNKIICISTQLIEAGVDISFDCVIRSLAGLDSIAQAAGRCNRHGEKDIRNVYIIDHEEENLKYLKEIKVGRKVSKQILIDIHNNPKNHGGSILSKQAMERYFKEFYTELNTDLDYFIPKLRKPMMELLTVRRVENSYFKAYLNKEGKPFPLYLVNSYQTAAENFHVIKNNTISVIVPYEEGAEIIAELNENGTIDELSHLIRKAQRFSVNLYNYEIDKLASNDGLISLMGGQILALKEGAYSEKYGVELENDSHLRSSIF